MIRKIIFLQFFRRTFDNVDMAVPHWMKKMFGVA